MAIALSPTVVNNLMRQVSFTHAMVAHSTQKYSRLVFAFISNSVAVPTNKTELTDYLISVMNNSSNDGQTAGANKNNILAFAYVSLSDMSKVQHTDNLFSITSPITCVVNASGTIGSMIVFAPTHGINQNSGVSLTSGSGAVSLFTTATPSLDNGTSSNGADTIMIPSTISAANYNAFHSEMYSSFNFITDSISTTGTPIVKVSSMTTSVGTSFQLSSLQLRFSSLNS